MLAFDFQAPGGPRLRYSFVSYVAARQLVSESGLVALRWWLDTDEQLGGRPTWFVELEPLAEPLRSLSQQATTLRDRFHQQHQRWPTSDDAGWLASQPAARVADESPEASFLRAAFLLATPPATRPAPGVAPAPVAKAPVVTPPAPSPRASLITPPPAAAVTAPAPVDPPSAPVATPAPVVAPAKARKTAARKVTAAPVAIAPIATRAAVVEPEVAAPVGAGLRRSRGDLLMVLRAHTGATSIYSASQRRMVPLHYP